MGTLQLDCPLCCNEVFDDLQSLKYHLLSLIENILCPECNARFSTILELANHLDNNCDKTDHDLELKSEVNIKIENDDSSDYCINNSILAKALLSNKSNTKASTNLGNNDTNKTNNEMNISKEKTVEILETQIEEVTEQTEDMYSCVGCKMTFTNIVEHVQQHHDGEEVIVEMTDCSKDSNKEDLLKSLSEGTAIISDENIENVMLGQWGNDEDDDASTNTTDSDSQENEETSTSNRTRLPQILNTIKQENCVDKDGRLYTRKVVQIEKFWDENQAYKNKLPIIMKYIPDGEGNLIKLEEGDVVVPNGIDIIEIFQCRVCNVQFHKRDQFNTHSCEPEIGSEYKCSMCDYSFINAQSLSTHMRTHKKNRTDNFETSPTGPFICHVCDTEFTTNKSLRLHRRMHDPIKSKEIIPPVHYNITGNETEDQKPREMFECKVCGKTYDKTYEDIHMAYHNGTNNYDCYICNRKFYTASNLEMHMRVHGTEKGHLCKHCKKGFLTEESLQQHLKQHCSSRPYQCSYCFRRFARPHEKVKHERIHTGEKPHECEICGKTFRVSYCLTLHMRTHSGYRPYVCQHCGKRFKAHSVYNHHLLTHSDVRNYKCPYCPKAFKTGVQLAGHKNSHTKPFSCTVCNRPFASLYAVRAHMETHTRENNLKYNCYLCGASYARAFALRDHIKEVHVDVPQNEDISLDIIEEGYEDSSNLLPTNDDITMVTLEMETPSNDANEEATMEVETNA